MAKQTMGFSSQTINCRADQKIYHLQVLFWFSIGFLFRGEKWLLVIVIYAWTVLLLINPSLFDCMLDSILLFNKNILPSIGYWMQYKSSDANVIPQIKLYRYLLTVDTLCYIP